MNLEKLKNDYHSMLKYYRLEMIEENQELFAENKEMIMNEDNDFYDSIDNVYRFANHIKEKTEYYKIYDELLYQETMKFIENNKDLKEFMQRIFNTK